MQLIKRILFGFVLIFTNYVFAQNIDLKQTKLPLQFNTGNPAPYGMPSAVITIQSKKIPLIFDTGAQKLFL